MSQSFFSEELPKALSLPHFGLVTPYGDIERSQHWLRQWIGAVTLTLNVRGPS